MTCPSCGTIAPEGAERCGRCRGLLQVPEHQPDFPIPVLRAQTKRGEAAQRAAGIVPTVLAKPSPPRLPATLPGAGPVPVGAPGPVVGTGEPAQPGGWLPPTEADGIAVAPPGRPFATQGYPPPAQGYVPTPAGPPPAGYPPPAQGYVPTPAGPPPSAPAGSPRLPAAGAVGDPPGRRPAFAVPPPPPAVEQVPRPAHPARGEAVGPQEPALPVLDPAGAMADSTVPVPVERDETVPASPASAGRDEHRPRLDAPWPPPPGPWSGRRSTSGS